ncbi:putative 4F5 protein family [Leishmania naiffi]|uniref:4F5 protein family n=1 Tax=Leishmania naiffi TaxID=5678 RepID=A0AAW3C7K0_9TRYP
MTRGNQRDLAREKNMKKQQEKDKGHRVDGLSHASRREADAERMRQKQAAADERKNAGGS